MSLSTFVYTAPEAGAAFQRARDLCGQLGDAIEQFPVLLGLWSFYLVRGEIDTAIGLAEDCLRLGTDQQRTDCLAETFSALGYALMYRGDFKASVEQLQECVRMCAEHDKVDHYATQHHPLVAGQSLLVHLAWLTGNRALSRDGRMDAIATAERLDRPFDRTYACCYAAELQIMRRRYAEGARYAALALELAQRYGFTLWEEAARFHQAMALNGLGKSDEAIVILEKSLHAWQEKGAGLHRAYFLAGLAESYRDAGRQDDALNMIEQAYEHAEEFHEYFFLAEILRLRGELRAHKEGPGSPGVRSDLERARDFAEQQGARFFHLRALASLYRLDHEAGRPAAGGAALATQCEELAADGFAEEADVLAARTLTEESIATSV
jgi:adenylate cyclase